MAEKLSHKYVKRTGYPGKYVYWYKMPDGSIRPGDENQQRTGAVEHASRLVAGKGEHHEMSHKEIASKTGLDAAHIKEIESNMKAHEKNGRKPHDYDKSHLREAATDSHHERREKYQKEIDKRAANRVNVESKLKELEGHINDIKSGEKTLRSEPTEPMDSEKKSEPKKVETKGKNSEKKGKIEKIEPAKGDKGLPDNNMSPPPPENEKFIKAGKQVTFEDTASFIKEFHKDFKSIAGEMSEDLHKAGAGHFSSRLKDENSLLEKMNERKSDRSLNSMTDVIGARGLAGTPDKQKALLKHVEKNYEVVEKEDFSDKPRKDGYRAIHILFRTPSGKIAELQLKTYRQQLYSGFTHDQIYKGPDHIKNDPEVKTYANDLSEYLYYLDKGGKDDPAKRPHEPKALAKAGIMFPWQDLARTEELSKAAKKVKWYATVRHHQTKENLHTHEFKTFGEAHKFKKSQRKSGFKGEIPLGHAYSKAEYLDTFSEYKSKGPGSRGGVVTGTYPSGKPKYLKKSLVINTKEPPFNPEPPTIDCGEIRKSFNIPDDISNKERISLIKGIMIGRQMRRNN